MSAVKSWVVFCEGCNQSESSDAVPNPDTTLARVRAELRELGWHRASPGYDICPDCWEAGVRGPLAHVNLARSNARRAVPVRPEGEG